MKKLFVSTIALAAVLSAASAFAADLPSHKGPPSIPPPPPPLWTGFYAGLNIGGGFGNGDPQYGAEGANRLDELFRRVFCSSLRAQAWTETHQSQRRARRRPGRL